MNRSVVHAKKMKRLLVITIYLYSACGDDPQPADMTVVDMPTVDMSVDMMDMSVIDPPKKGAGESCDKTSECERGLGCDPFQRFCIDRSNCLLDWVFERGGEIADDEGCVVRHYDLGYVTTKECDVDADCEGKASERCQFRICQDYAGCTLDADCEAPLLCIGNDENMIMSVCAP